MHKIAMIVAGVVVNIVVTDRVGATFGDCLIAEVEPTLVAEEQEGFADLTNDQQYAAGLLVVATDSLNVATRLVAVAGINAQKGYDKIVDVTDTVCGIGWDYSVVDDVPVFVNPDA